MLLCYFRVTHLYGASSRARRLTYLVLTIDCDPMLVCSVGPRVGQVVEWPLNELGLVLRTAFQLECYYKFHVFANSRVSP